MMVKVYRSAILTFLCFISLANAQNATFVATVEPDIITTNEQFQVIFTFSGSDVSNLKNFKAPDFSQFVVLSGPNQSTSMQWINGQMSASVSYSYILYARQPGKYKIGPATIEYKGEIYKTNPLEIEITKSAQKQQSKKEKDDSGLDVGDNIFIKASVDKSIARIGEQITVTFKLYTRLSIANYELAKAPTFEGFWSEDFEMPKTPTVTVETINGKQYKVAVIKKTALFATQAGNLKIAPLEIKCAVQIQSKRKGSDWFDSFFNDPFFQQYQTVSLEIKSNPITISVQPLPGNSPSSFTGSVGKFTFSTSVDKKTVSAGDPVTLKLIVSGTGNIRLAKLPKPVLPADFEYYEPKVSEEIQREGGIIRGKKIAEYLLIPRNPGKRVIEPIQFTYFDLDKKDYVTLTSPRFDISVEPGKNLASTGVSITSKEDIRLLGEDIRYLKLSIGELQRKEETSNSHLFYIALFLPPLMFVGSWIYRKRMEKIYGDMPRLLFETAGREANRRLKKARSLLEQGNTKEYHAEIHKALTGYLEHKLGIPKAKFALDEAILRLKANGVSENTIKALRGCIEKVEFMHYASSSDSTSARKELLESAIDVIKGIEESFGKKGKR